MLCLLIIYNKQIWIWCVFILTTIINLFDAGELKGKFLITITLSFYKKKPTDTRTTRQNLRKCEKFITLNSSNLRLLEIWWCKPRKIDFKICYLQFFHEIFSTFIHKCNSKKNENNSYFYKFWHSIDVLVTWTSGQFMKVGTTKFISGTNSVKFSGYFGNTVVKLFWNLYCDYLEFFKENF